MYDIGSQIISMPHPLLEQTQKVLDLRGVRIADQPI